MSALLNDGVVEADAGRNAVALADKAEQGGYLRIAFVNLHASFSMPLLSNST
jgi:hypothetical protein